MPDSTNIKPHCGPVVSRGLVLVQHSSRTKGVCGVCHTDGLNLFTLGGAAQTRRETGSSAVGFRFPVCDLCASDIAVEGEPVQE